MEYCLKWGIYQLNRIMLIFSAANQILSILKKSAARDTNKVVKDSPVEQCLSKHNIEGSLQVDCCQEIRAAGKHTITSTMTADRVQASTCYEGNVMQSGPIDIDSSAPYLYAKNIDTAEIPVSTQTAETIKPNALESPSKSQNTVGYSVGLEKSVILDSSKGKCLCITLKIHQFSRYGQLT